MSTENKKENPAAMSAIIPFCGFYESAATAMIDWEIESAFNYNDSGDSAIPQDAFFEIEYHSIYKDFAAAYAEAFNEYFESETGLTLGAEYETMQSPREYNFTTDRVFVFVPYENMKAIYNHLMRDDSRRRILADTIRERHSSRSGFISFYSSDFESWRAKPLREYDHNEMKTLIVAALACEGVEELPYYEMMESYSCNGHLSSAIYSAMPERLNTFAALQYDARRELDYKAFKECPEYAEYMRQCVDSGAPNTIQDFETWRESKDSPEYAPPYRCDKTPDMFKA